MRSRAWRLCRQDPAGRHPEGKKGVCYCPGLAQRRHVQVCLTTRPRWGPQSWIYPGLSQGPPAGRDKRPPPQAAPLGGWPGVHTQPRQPGPRLPRLPPQPAPVAQELVRPPQTPAAATGLTEGKQGRPRPGVLPPCRLRRPGRSPAQTYVLRAAADGPVTCCAVLGRKLAAGGRAVAETTRGHTE